MAWAGCNGNRASENPLEDVTLLFVNEVTERGNSKLGLHLEL